MKNAEKETCDQCDQMGKYFVDISAIYMNENLSNGIQNVSK